MKRPTAVLVLVACAIGSAFAPASPVGAIAELTYTPTSGPPGTVIDFEGTCTPGFNADLANLVVSLVSGQPGGPFNFWVEESVTADAFSGSLTVPPDAPAGNYTISVGCFNQDQVDGFAKYPFTVTASGSSTTVTSTTEVTTTTAPSTTVAPTTTPQPTSTLQQAPPAPSVTVRPAYTG